jgi:hypothetical protein
MLSWIKEIIKKRKVRKHAALMLRYEPWHFHFPHALLGIHHHINAESGLVIVGFKLTCNLCNFLIIEGQTSNVEENYPIKSHECVDGKIVQTHWQRGTEELIEKLRK